MNINIEWSNPYPYPDCDFKASYRRMADPAYTTIDTSGTTSGSTVNAYVPAPANYEGYAQSNCCEGNLSEPLPFGINSYVYVNIAITTADSPLRYVATITSAYPNPYDTILTGTFVIGGDTPGTVNWQATYPASSISAVIDLIPTPPSLGVAISDIIVTDIDPQFAGGGSLQQLDSLRTPPYFQFYNESSGNTWNGSPASLPSFTLNAFNVTEYIANNVVASGELLMSWIQSTIYNNGEGINGVVIFEIYDPTPTLLGTLIVNASPKGLRNATITLNKGGGYLLSTSTLLTMKVFAADDSLIDTHTFYLPAF